jgi:hypothetical protein
MLDTPGGSTMKFILTAASLLAFAGLCFAQTQTPMAKSSAPAAAAATTKDPVATSLRLLFSRSQNNTVGAVEAMPADKYSYKPTPEQMTFSHLVAHIANSNNSLCAKVADVPAPKAEESKETDSKDQLVAAVKASYSFCNDALTKMDDSKLGDTVELFGRQLPRATGALALAGGWADHYATAAMYLRLNNILPPSAQPKK